MAGENGGTRAVRANSKAGTAGAWELGAGKLQPALANAPSSSGRTADFESVRRGSNPRGATTPGAGRARPGACGRIRRLPRRRGEVVQHGGLQNLYSPVR